MAKEVPQMVRGLGMAMRLITSLSSEVRAAGGREEQLHFLTTDRGNENLKKVAALIASLEWRVPKSLIMELARQKSMKEYRDGYYVERDSCFTWGPTLDELGIPHIDFRYGIDYESGQTLLPDELRRQLDGRKAAAGMIVEWEGQPHVVASIGGSCLDLEVGDVMKASEIGWLYITSVDYIDLEH